MISETYLSPLWISLKTVLTATVITFFLGIAAAHWMAGYRGWLKNAIDGLFIMPLVLPPTVVGLGLLMLFGKHGPIGVLLWQIGATVVFTWTATVISAVTVSFPLMYMTARGAFEQIETNIEGAARTLGASEWRIFWSVTLPLAWPGVVAGTILAMARSRRVWGDLDAGRQYPWPDADNPGGNLFCRGSGGYEPGPRIGTGGAGLRLRIPHGPGLLEDKDSGAWQRS